jgi:hypothetical protein
MAEDPTAEISTRPARTWLAFAVVGVAVVGITILAVAVVVVDSANAQNVFNILVPVVASWVGTVLAFYFGRDNYESANREMRQLVRELTPDERAKEPVTSIMRLGANLTSIRLSDGAEVDVYTIQDLKYRYVGQISRLPILNPDGTVLYLIHQSRVDQFLANGGALTDTLASFVAARAGEPFPIRFDYGHGFLTVSPTATLADVKGEIDRIESVQDVFVTADGSPRSEMLGWVSNIRLSRFLPS